MEEIIFKRRNRLKNHFVNTSNVLLYGYHHVSDAAKITFQVIDGFDWESAETGDSKGYVFPATQTLAKIRQASTRTVQRHIKELEDAGLLTKKRRRNKSSILIIEDVSDQEIQTYLDIFVDHKKKGKGSSGGPSNSNTPPKRGAKKSTNDKNVVSQIPQTTKMSVAYIKKEKEDTFKEKENNVNEDFQSKKRAGSLGSIGEILKSYQLQVPTQRKTKSKPDGIVKRDYLAEKLASDLHDLKSLGCYRVIADKIPQEVIFQVLASVKETASAGRIRQSRGALFVSIVSRYAEKNSIDLWTNVRQGNHRALEQEAGKKMAGDKTMKYFVEQPPD